MATDLIPRGTDKEQETFMVCRSHYDRSGRDLDLRKSDFDTNDEIFRSYIDEGEWPYRAQVADPSVFTFIIEKTSRLISNKLRGKVEPREGSDWLKAKVANELLNYQWDQATQGGSMILKWALMDLNTRKYGAAFGICKWRYERKKGDKEPTISNPEFEVCTNRDVLVNPDYSDVKDWFQYRKYITYEELVAVNELAADDPVYKNLDILKASLKERGTEKGDRRDVNYLSRNKSISGLSDTLGDDTYTKYIEIVKEYRPDKIITFAPKHGVILQDEKNPYGEIPVVLLKYYPIDDDIYGLSEIEPIEKLQKVENALISQYLDTINTDLYPPLLVNTGLANVHTLEFGPNKKWLVTDVNNAVKRFETSSASTTQFTATVSFIISRMQNAVGASGQGVSNIDPFSPDKTATEVRDQSIQRLARDQFNQIFLSEALKKQMLLWLKMNAKFISKNTLIRISGQDSLASFKSKMLVTPPQGALDEVTGQPLKPTPYGPDEIGNEVPAFPVEQKGELVPKFQMDDMGEVGELIVEPKDLDGTFDYIPDVESMSLQNTEDSKKKLAMINMVINPAVQAQLQQEGMKAKLHDLLVEGFEDAGFKDAKRFFEEAPMGQMGAYGQEVQPNGLGAVGTPAGVQPAGNVPNQGIPGGTQTVPGNQNA